MPTLRGLVRIGVTVACAVGVITPAGAAADWPRYGGNDQMTNDVPAERAAGLSAATAPSLTERWSTMVGGRFVASPLFAEDVPFGDHTEDVVYAATNGGTVAALRARDGAVLWKRQVSGTVTTCSSTYGISSTPVLDRGRNRMYVAGADGLLRALDLSTGESVRGWPVRVIEHSSAEYVWGGLTFYGTRVYVPVASYCDKADEEGYLADGRLLAVDVVDAAVVLSFDVVPGPNDMGGIWGYGGSSVDPLTGHIWTTTGNSWTYDPECGCIVETAGYSEGVVELDADLNVLDWNRPEGIPYIEDNDFGASPLLFQPEGCPPLAAAHAKNGTVYVWLRASLGGGPIWSARVGPDDIASAFISQPSYSRALNMLFISNARDYDDEGAIRNVDAVVGFEIGDRCELPARPSWTTPGVGIGPKTPPLVVDDVVLVPGGFDSHVYALEARTGTVVWSAALPGRVLAPIAWANGSVLVGDTSGVLHAFGIPRPARGVGRRDLIPI